MPERKLSYKVDVDTGTAVRDLEKLGKAGGDAGRDIADGFDTAKSASAQALDALSANLDQVETDAKGLASAVAAIKANLTVDVDDSKVAGFASDLKNKMGVAFDQVEADARQFAAVLERGVDLSRTTSEIRGVGDELEHVRSNGDQSRSVLANLAGNAAQDLGQLGGVVGSLGVGVGQLAEYAVDGNIAMSDLAGVAGPMLGLTAALALVQGAAAEVAAEDAFNTAQVDAYKSAIDDVGPGLESIQQRLQDLSDAVPADGKGNALTNLLRTGVALAGNLGELANPIANISGHITNYAEVLGNLGFTYEDLSDVIAGGEPARQEFEDHLKRIPQAEGLTANIIRFVTQQQDAYAEAVGVSTDQLDEYAAATNKGTGENKFYASSLGSINDALKAQRISDDPLAALSDRFFTLNGQVYDLQALWQTLVTDLADGKADFAGSAAYADVLGEAMGKTGDEVAVLASQQTSTIKTTGDLGTATHDAAAAQDDAAAAAQATTDALRDQADAIQADIDKARDMIDASHDWADSQQDFRDATADLDGIMATTNATMADSTATIEDQTDAQRKQRDTAEDWVDQLVATRQEFDKGRGVTRSAAQTQDDYAEGLGRIAGHLNADVIPAVAAYYANVLQIPTDKITAFEVVLATGDQDKIETFIAENSGTKTLGIEVTTDEAKLAKVDRRIQTVGDGATAVVAVDGDMTRVNNDLANLQKQVNNNPIHIPATLTVTRTVGVSGGYVKGRSAAPSADQLGAAPAPAASSSSTGPALALAAPAPSTVNVTLNAGVVGNRYDLQRWLRAATRDQQRLGRM